MKRLALDIGVNSVGVALREQESDEILYFNSFIFKQRKTTKSENKTAKRREARAGRRTLQRKSQRKKSVAKLLVKYNLVPETFLNVKEYKKRHPHKNLFYLRYKATKERIADYKLASILYSFAKRRGYSDRYEIRDSKSDDENDTKVIKKSINQTKQLMEDGNYDTIGQMLWDKHKNQKIRNSKNNYENLATMKLIKDEIKFIFDKQREFGNSKLTDEFLSEILNTQAPSPNQTVALFYQRPLKDISDMVGLCTYQYEKGYKRASKATYTFLEYSFFEALHNTTVFEDGEETSLFRVMENRDIPIEEALQKLIKNKGKYNLTFIKNLFSKEQRKNLVIKVDKKEIKNFGTDACILYNKLEQHLNSNPLKTFKKEQIDEIATILAIKQSTEQRAEELQKLSCSLQPQIIEEISKLNFSGFGRLSTETMQEMLPYIKSGFTPTEAKEKLKYTKSKNKIPLTFLPPLNCDRKYIDDILSKKQPQIDKEKFIPFYEPIINPTVERVISVVRFIINNIIEKYGVPDEITIEMARDYNSKKDKAAIKKDQAANRKYNEQLKKEIENLGYDPNFKNIEKYRYWKEQEERCIYSGEKIPIQILFTESIEIDHVLPKSKVYINSRKNKIVVFSNENQNKQSSYHYDYLKQQGKWEDFIDRVQHLERDKRITSSKAKWLLRENFENITSENSLLNDTKYAAKLVAAYLKYYLYPTEDIYGTGSKRRIKTVNGIATALFRRLWGLESKKDGKNRTNHIHHAIDAIVLSYVDDSMISELSKYFEKKEKKEKDIFKAPHKGFREKIEQIRADFENEKRYVYHIQKKRLNDEAFTQPIKIKKDKSGNPIMSEKNFYIKIDRIKVPEGIFDIKTKSDQPKKIKEIAQNIIDDSTDKFLKNNIEQKLTEKLNILYSIEDIKKEIKKVRNDENKRKELEIQKRRLEAQKLAPIVIERGKKRTPQIVKYVRYTAKLQQNPANTIEVYNKKDKTPKYCANKTSIGLEIWEKEEKGKKEKVAVKLFVHSFWESNKDKPKFSKTGKIIDENCKHLMTLYPKTVVQFTDDKGSTKRVLYNGVGKDKENFEYKPINVANGKESKQLYLSLSKAKDLQIVKQSFFQ